ncbi:MAG TPA: DUF4397 domain-containing protein [Puia sp.]|nr:DUF4397 domain-containing protein [Puia sp.]
MRLAVITLAVFLFGCAKVKIDTNLPILNTLKSSNSSIRLIALAGPNQVNAVIGGFTYNLTPNVTTIPFGTCHNGTITEEIQNYNPVAVSIPAKLLDQAGNAHVQLVTTIPTSGSVLAIDTVFADAPSNPTDYYIFPVSQSFGDPNYNIVAVPRSTTPPAGVSNIKIRLVNMGSPVDTFHLTGPLTLTYMDGTPVSSVTTGVPDGVSSAYTEIPYGTYHFRIFTQSGLELPETILPAPNLSSLSSIHSFQPGGIYTIFVNSNNLYELGSCSLTGTPGNNVSGNSFTIVADITPPVNISYGKVQFVNTIPGTTCSLALDNLTIGSSIPYRGISPYQPVSVGSFSMQLTNNLGQPLARQNLEINPDDNFTIWAYVKDGQPALAISYNDLTNPNAGQKLRFMNCSVDIPYITVTQNGQLLQVYNPSSKGYYTPDINDTTSAADATENLAQGVPATHEPFTLIITGQSGPEYPLSINQSDAGPPPFVPGVTLPSVKQLLLSDFIFKPSLYQPGSLIYARGEPGVYTVALTGSVKSAESGAPQPDTLLIVKHFN